MRLTFATLYIYSHMTNKCGYVENEGVFVRLTIATVFMISQSGYVENEGAFVRLTIATVVMISQSGYVETKECLLD